MTTGQLCKTPSHDDGINLTFEVMMNPCKTISLLILPGSAIILARNRFPTILYPCVHQAHTHCKQRLECPQRRIQRLVKFTSIRNVKEIRVGTSCLVVCPFSKKGRCKCSVCFQLSWWHFVTVPEVMMPFSLDSHCLFGFTVHFYPTK